MLIPQPMRLLGGLLLMSLVPALCHAADDLSRASTEELESHLEKIESELEELARFTLRSGVGNIGWISQHIQNPNNSVWVEVELPADTIFEQIVLVPVLWHDAEKGPQADGFPEAFKIIAGAKGDTKGRVIAEMGPDDHFLPRIAPLVIDVPATSASWVRIITTRLSPHARDGMYSFKLAELMIFSGERNIALNSPVAVSSVVGGWGAGAIYKKALVDGLTPYLMDAVGEEKSNPYMAHSKTGDCFTLSIDLKEICAIDGIRFHSADVNEYIPQINPSDFGMPTRFSIEGANQANFSDAVVLLDYQRKSNYQAGNIMEWKIPESSVRHMRMVVPKDAWPINTANKEYCISLAEIEMLSKGKNVAVGKSVVFPKPNVLPFQHGLIPSLTDGKNHFGKILSTRDWINQLARRHELELKHPAIGNALNQKYLRQKTNLMRMSWLAALLAASIAFIILLDRIFQMRAVLKVRERIAANLHDEISASLHAMVLLGDMAKKHIEKPEKLTEVVDHIQKLSKRSRIAARHCANMLQSDTLCEVLVKEMKFSADRLLFEIDHEMTIEGEEFLLQMPKRKRNGLFLF